MKPKCQRKKIFSGYHIWSKPSWSLSTPLQIPFLCINRYSEGADAKAGRKGRASKKVFLAAAWVGADIPAQGSAHIQQPQNESLTPLGRAVPRALGCGFSDLFPSWGELHYPGGEARYRGSHKSWIPTPQIPCMKSGFSLRTCTS